MRIALGYCRNSVLSRCLQTAYGAKTVRASSRRAASVNEDLQNVLHRKSVLPETQKFSDGVAQLISAYREHGHKLASVDPLGLWQPVREVPELHPAMYGFSGFKDDISVDGFLGLSGISSVGELVAALQNIYCSTISAEFQHLQTLEERLWFAEKFEHIHKMNVSVQKRKEISKLLSQTQAFDNFLANKFPTLKRYGGEGAEGNLVFVNEILQAAVEDNYSDAVICMPHRGRLNVLALNLNYDPSYMFLKIAGKSEFPEGVTGYGDVLSHLFTTVDLDYGQGRKLHVSMIPNPSHLEANNPVAVGKARGRQQKQRSGEYSKDDTEKNKVLCVQIHGDASFSGQGIVPETFVFANLPRYTVGGSVHFITNNQVGFTTPGSIGRSSTYASDIAKMNACPILHVNGDCPEDVLRATRLAFDYKNKFGKDIVIDMVCYRLHGHNEVDDPTFTQPIMYGAIQSRKSLPDTYAENLLREGILTPEESKGYSEDYTNFLREKFSSLSSFKPEAYHLKRQWSGLVQPGKNNSVWDTGFPADALKFIGAKSVEFPGTFNIHPHLLKTHVKSRLDKLKEGKSIDWATAEALAIGSLLLQGFNVRISGQDVGRGTFSHRHALLTDQQTNLGFVPLNHMHENQETFYEVANSVLSEEAVLGFEYGMSIEDPTRLVIWEAQFGDFFNGAQIIIDTYIGNGETKWLLQSGLVMLLPHGYDGAGPEHSSCRIERFLQQTDSSEVSVDGDNVNFSFVNATTPAQYFHLLRRQMLRNYRKPLIVAAPKTVLRLAAATSQLNEMSPGRFFSPVLPDITADSSKVDKVVFVSGKHYYALDSERKAKKMENTALIRVEELCPFPVEGLLNEIKKYPKAKQFIWAQEEPRNMGAWTFVQPRLRNLLGINAKYAGRPELPLPAVGIGLIHEQQVKDILQQVFQ